MQYVKTGKLIIVLLIAGVNITKAQRHRPRVVATIDGDSMYQVLPAGTIPAILNPTFVAGTQASAQMSEDEPVMGLVVNGEAKAYSLWQLDAHEIVNDTIGETPIAATW